MIETSMTVTSASMPIANSSLNSVNGYIVTRFFDSSLTLSNRLLWMTGIAKLSSNVFFFFLKIICKFPHAKLFSKFKFRP